MLGIIKVQTENNSRGWSEIPTPFITYARPVQNITILLQEKYTQHTCKNKAQTVKI